ncbi:MAG: TonB-dependent receptor [Acidobacteriota bacterium]|nr:TonB-dependent receptor [Acidobacteriota bacterium]
MPITKLIFLTAFLLVCFFHQTVKAQTISGTVRDERQAPVADAQVNLVSANQVVSRAKTDENGDFSLTTSGAVNLALQIRAAGFARFEKRLDENENRLEITLSPENVSAEVTVSIARTETRLSETPASVVVLNRENLEQTAAQTVDDALRQVAGFQLFRRSSSRATNPTAQGANFRGLAGSGASRSSVLFDGISLNDAFGGWTYWSRVPRASVEQIEILRGGASALYGNAALSGAINILTRNPDSPFLRLETSLGTQETADASAFGGFGFNKFFFRLAAEGYRTGGYIPVTEQERGIADAEANSRHNSLLPILEYRLNENARIFARGNLFSERRDNGTRLQNNRTYFRQIAAGADFSGEKTGAFNFRLFAENQIYDQSFSAVSADRNTETLTRLQRVPSQAAGANLFWNRAFARHVLSAAFEIRQVRGASDEIIYGNNRQTSAVGAGGREQTISFFAQDFWRATEKLNLQFGARFDRWKNERAFSATQNLANRATTINIFPDRNESAFNPRLAALYQINSNLAAFASFGKSFRAPTLNELYRAFRVGNVLTQANENLRAERASNLEAGLNFSGFQNRLTLRGVAFLTEVSLPIVNVTISSTPSLITRQRQNVGVTRSHGVELDAEFAARRDLRLSASYLLVDSRIRRFPANAVLIGKFLPQVPRQQLNFQAFYRPNSPFSLGAQGRISDAQFEDDLNTLRLRPFFTLDVFAAYKIRKEAEVFAAIENVFNSRYDIGLTPNRTIAAPRFLRIGLRLNLGKN